MLFRSHENPPKEDWFSTKQPCVYYGSFRKGRMEYFRKYFRDWLAVSTSARNHAEFWAAGLSARWVGKLMWTGIENRLFGFASSLYIEDEKTHSHYNHLANRFYEGLSHGVPSFFDESCRGTVKLSGYEMDDFWFVDGPSDLKVKSESLLRFPRNYPRSFLTKASRERTNALNSISSIIIGRTSGQPEGEQMEECFA